MKAGRRLIALLFLVAALSFVALPALAQDETVEPTPISATLEPAVTIPTVEADETTADWTYRYMIPTAIALGAVVIVVTSAQYFTQVVRKRYRIVEE